MKGTQKLKTYISEVISDSFEYIPAALHDMTLIQMTVVRVVGTGAFFIRYSNGHTK